MQSNVSRDRERFVCVRCQEAECTQRVYGQDRESCNEAPLVGAIPAAGLTVMTIAEAQRKDPQSQAIWRKIQGPGQKNGWMRRDGLVWRDVRGSPKVYVPTTLLSEVVAVCHAGHPGFRETWERVRERFRLGPGGRAKVYRAIRNCEVCQQQRAPLVENRSRTLKDAPVRPFERVGWFPGPVARRPAEDRLETHRDTKARRRAARRVLQKSLPCDKGRDERGAPASRVYKPGEQVLTGFSRKRQPQLRGPWTARRRVASHTYRVLPLTDQSVTLNVKDLRPWRTGKDPGLQEQPCW